MMSNNRFVNKVQAVLDKYFHKIFNNSHFFYTIIFFLLAMLIALLSLIPGSVIGNIILFLAIVTSITFILLMFEALIPQLEKYLFSTEKKFDKWKVICFIINFLISFVLILVYFVLSTDIDIPLLRWGILLPFFLIVIYFGWNLAQIFFLRVGFEDISIKVDDKITDKYGFSKKKDTISLILLIFAILVPFLLQFGTLFGLLDLFQPPTIFIVCNLIIFIIIAITSWRLFTLYLRSKKNDSTNAFASVFYILIWIVIWFRSISFLNSLRGFLASSTEVDMISNLIDILLMVFTSIMVLRSLGTKVQDSFLFNKNNMPFFLFSFLILYIEGQIIMITEAGDLPAVFNNRNQISLTTSFIIIAITVIFYWWYSEHSLERKGFLLKKRYYPDDVALILNDFKEFLVNNNALVADKVGDEKMEEFLRSKNINIPEPKQQEDESVIESNSDLS
jgi:hypothetical protein